MAQAQPVEIRSIARARTLAIDVGGIAPQGLGRSTSTAGC